MIATSAFAAEPETVLRGGTVYDGTGKPPIVADVLIRGEKIVAIGKVEITKDTKVIDCKGLVVAPASSTCTRTATTGIATQDGTRATTTT